MPMPKEMTLEGLTILEELKPLFIKARNEGLWFNCHYQNLWFSPDELEAKHKNGKFIWSACNWHLENPIEELNHLTRKIETAKEAYSDFKLRVHKYF